ncbi:MAG TPA: Bax inhibitor-1/YccA family protein [Chloroflexota bacterium]|jgi:FtsH-binding integral membrane protein|nr:Bax inhibitor-1/YccA family protein [Chloroflexota bacterium]
MAASVTGVPVATPSVGAATQRFLTLVYLVMAVGMAVTAAVSGSVSSNPEMVRRILFDPWFTWGLFFVQLALVAFLSAAVMRMAPGVAFLVFLAYAALTGVSLSAIFLFYSQETITSAFVVAAGMFLLSSLAGLLIRRDLSGGAQFVLMILLGWMFAYFISWFFPAGSLIGQTTTAVGILLFAGLTVWDTQRLKQLAAELAGRQGMGGMVVLGALTLYLDFINLFLLLLRRSSR